MNFTSWRHRKKNPNQPTFGVQAAFCSCIEPANFGIKYFAINASPVLSEHRVAGVFLQ